MIVIALVIIFLIVDAKIDISGAIKDAIHTKKNPTNNGD